LDEARHALARAKEYLVEQPENFLRNPWCHLARRGLLEELHGDRAQAAQWLAQARAASPFPAAFLWFAQTAWRIYAAERKGDGPFQAELRAAGNEKPAAADALVLARIYFFWRTAPDSPGRFQEEPWLRRYLKRAAQNPFARDEARQLVELLRRHDDFHDEARTFVRSVLQNDHGDTLFRLYEYALQPFALRDPETDRERLRSILDVATGRGDAPAVQLARELLADVAAPPVPHWDGAEEDPDFPGGQIFPLPPGSEKNPAMLSEISAVLAGMSDKEIRRARKTWPKDIPSELFDALVAVATGQAPSLPWPPHLAPSESQASPAGSPPRPRPPPVHPDQMNLF